MKAAYITQWCDEGKVAETITFGDIAAPTPPLKNHVVIQVKASSINVDDVALLQDSAGGGWFFHGRTPTVQQPFVGGMEYAGVVLSVGPKCKKLKVGDRVCGIQDRAVQKNAGTWAEQTSAPETDVVLIPEDFDISFVEAASVCMGAYIAGDIYKRGELPDKGDFRCLVVGASGGLGLILLQLLSKHSGANLDVTAVCSGKNSESVRRNGAHHVIDYNIAPFDQQLKTEKKFDVVFDFVGGVETETGVEKVLKRGGKFITACGPLAKVGDRKLSCCEWHGWCCGLLGRLLKSNFCCCCTSYRYEMGGGMPPMKQEDFDNFVVEKGIRAGIGMEVPFTEDGVREALRKTASRHAGGKVVINMES